MPVTSTHLLNAIRRNSLSSVDLLLRYGLPPEHPAEDDTPLMTAAGMGNLEIVQRLVDAGADVNRCDHDDSQITAAWYAENAGNTEVAAWLTERMSMESL
ncbi:ankyrin repeat domain-containing protein [Acaryochloris marina NIES-2412]|uniref:ankyrin repeat domain-containing protein n=1 Tax=Acaryochloris marina TaxID=155978 RepID=UPI004057FA39